MTKYLQRRIDKISRQINGSDSKICEIILYDPSQALPKIISEAQTVYLLPNNERDADDLTDRTKADRIRGCAGGAA